MARVTITREFPDGDVVQVSVKAATSYPDALSQARVEAEHAFDHAVAKALEDSE
ncbi:MAG: hypothetical protein FWD95_01865 [Nocardioidaceae bacterium]|nr:hypothetical protein [Nocardioidaceae bacterium]